MATSNPTDRIASGEESPTTARPIDFDDEPQETGVIHNDSTAQAPVAPTTVEQQAASQEDEAPPPKPPRPLSPRQHAEATLIEAFPTIESKVVKAVLSASGGQVEPAFNALLGMSDPDAQIEETPPPQPPRPSRQVQQDELYARQLADHYRNSAHGYGARGLVSPPEQRQRQHNGFKPPEEQDRNHSFFDDDLPVIGENVRQGFLQTQSKVNKWFSDFRKRFDGDEDENADALAAGRSSSNAGGQLPAQTAQGYGISKGADGRTGTRRSVDQERYDSDPRVLSDNFTELEMRDEEDTPPRKPNRPLANPDLFKPTPPAPSGPVDEVDALYKAPSSSATKSKKWQPLTSVAPAPEPDENDPFSLGDSDDEAKNTDLRSADSERLKKAAAEAPPAGQASALEEQERAGSMSTRNMDAEKLMSEKS